jgi:hypothetical protein
MVSAQDALKFDMEEGDFFMNKKYIMISSLIDYEFLFMLFYCL